MVNGVFENNYVSFNDLEKGKNIDVYPMKYDNNQHPTKYKVIDFEFKEYYALPASFCKYPIMIEDSPCYNVWAEKIKK